MEITIDDEINLKRQLQVLRWNLPSVILESSKKYVLLLTFLVNASFRLQHKYANDLKYCSDQFVQQTRWVGYIVQSILLLPIMTKLFENLLLQKRLNETHDGFSTFS